MYSMYVWICVCMDVCMYVQYVCMDMCMYGYDLFMCLYKVYVCMFVFMYVCNSMYVCMCMFLFIYLLKHIYTGWTYSVQ